MCFAFKLTFVNAINNADSFVILWVPLICFVRTFSTQSSFSTMQTYFCIQRCNLYATAFNPSKYILRNDTSFSLDAVKQALASLLLTISLEVHSYNEVIRHWTFRGVTSKILVRYCRKVHILELWMNIKYSYDSDDP